MSLSIPELALPLGGIVACANKILLSEHADLAGSIPADRLDETAIDDAGKFYLRLIRERFDDGRCHFHLELYDKGFIKKAKTNSTVAHIIQCFTGLVGKTLSVNFESRFLLAPKDLPSVGLIKLLGSVGINLQGANATLSGASIRLSDSVYREIKWKQATPAEDGTTRYTVELSGSLGPVSVSDDLLFIVRERVIAGLQRFVLPHPQAVQPK